MPNLPPSSAALFIDRTTTSTSSELSFATNQHRTEITPVGQPTKLRRDEDLLSTASYVNTCQLAFKEEPKMAIVKTRRRIKQRKNLDVGVCFDTNKLGGFLPMRIIKNWKLFLKYEKVQFKFRRLQETIRIMDRTKFIFLQTITAGAFSRTAFAKHVISRQYFSIKIYEKKFLVKLNLANLAKNELHIMEACCFPFIANCVYFFHDYTYLYYVMPYCAGGELYSLLKQYHLLPEYMCKFFTAQVVLALEYLHYLNIIYRNLKPENVVIDHDGYIRLTDFTISKCLTNNNERTHTMCGSPAYLAPEMLTTIGYDKSVDYWALGVFIYEMVGGRTPFYNEDPLKTYKNILKCNYYLQDYFSFPLKNIIGQLLRPYPVERLGCRTGFKEIKNHYWFRGINWLKLLNKQCVPPYLPKLFGTDDLRYYGKYPDIIFPEHEKAVWSIEFENFN